MEQLQSNKKERVNVALVIGAICAAAFVALITVAGEEISWIKPWLKDQHYHHWIGKGIWAGVTFATTAILGYLFSKKATADTLARVILVLSYTLILGTLAMAGFFVLHFFKIIG